MQIPREVPEGLGEDAGGFCAVLEGSGADTL